MAKLIMYESRFPSFKSRNNYLYKPNSAQNLFSNVGNDLKILSKKRNNAH